MTQYAQSMTGSGQGITNRIEAALNFTQSLVDTKPQYILQNPLVEERFNRLKGQSRNYLAHEYFNRDWQPMYFADMAQRLQPAKLSFACSTNYLEHVDVLNLSQAQQQLIHSVEDPELQQTLRDYAINQQFRKDYWVKGPLKLDPSRQVALLRAQRVILTANRQDVTLKVQGYLGEASLNEGIYNPVLDLLADHKIHAIGEIESSLHDKGVNLAQIMQAIVVLVGMGHVYSAQDDEAILAAEPAAHKINGAMMQHARSNADLGNLASPVTGGGVVVPRFQQLFLLAIRQGMQQPKEWAQFVWQILSAQGQAILKDGKALPTAEENLAELNEQALAFAEKHAPIFKALLIA